MTLQEHPLLRTDSYGKIFLYTTHNDVACVPRHTIRMRDPVRPQILLQAVKTALLRFPHMMVGIEATETAYRYRMLSGDPVVLPFDGINARYTIGSSDTNGYMFLVGYQSKTIYMEYQHSICDGRGFEEFIRCVLFHYLLGCGYPVENDGSVRSTDTAYVVEESEDGFEKVRDLETSDQGIWTKTPALHAEGLTELTEAPEVVSELTFPFAALRQKAKALGVSPLSILAPLFSRAYYNKFDRGTGEAVIAQIPVDLRQILPSQTTRYFVCFIDLPYFPAYQDMPLDEVFRETKAFLASQMETGQLLFRAKQASDACRSLHERDVPLAEKEAEGRKLCRNFVLSDSFLITNVGEFKLPPSMHTFVEDYGAILPSAAQPFAMLISSYKGNMKISIAQHDHDLKVCADLAHMLESLGVPVKMMTYPFLVTRYDGKDSAAKGKL